MIVLAIAGAISGIFSSQERLELFLAQAGILAPGIFLLMPDDPGHYPHSSRRCYLPYRRGCFWPGMGDLYTTISALLPDPLSVFLLIRKYGKTLILKLVSEKNYNKYIGWLEKGKKFQILFAAAIFLPGFPDDVPLYAGPAFPACLWADLRSLCSYAVRYPLSATV